jgi:hypothetical protein
MRELTEFQKQYFESLRKEEQKELTKHSDKIASFKDLLAKSGIELKEGNFKYYTTSGIIATYPGLLGYLHESLKRDKEGLLNFEDLTKNFELKRFCMGYLFSENFMLMAHPNFRRGYHQINNFAPRFVELFWAHNDPKVEKYIALDFDSVRINVDNSAYREFDTWFGAKFNNVIADIPDGNVKLRPPLDVNEFRTSFFFADAYALDIKWATKDGIKSFQAEEFKAENITIVKDGEEYFPVRYVHAEFDIEKGHFRHFDGAIHFYTMDEYLDRRDSDFNYNSKNSKQIKTLSEKLFKMNGVVSIDTWIEFTSHFLTGNPLVFEYFEGQYPPHIIEMIEKIRALPADRQ